VPLEVQPLVAELNLLFGRVRETLQAQQHFVADAAHELRSPLTALKLQVQAGVRGRGSPAAAHGGWVSVFASLDPTAQ
jgi:two-component system OmpR family sensor kinase